MDSDTLFWFMMGAWVIGAFCGLMSAARRLYLYLLGSAAFFVVTVWAIMSISGNA